MSISKAGRTAHDTSLRDYMVPMRDGIRLATDIFFPEDASGGPWPVILERTPYDKRVPRANEYTVAHPEVFGREELVKFFTEVGFVVIFQDCRGRYGSEGHFVKYRSEAEDGFDTIAWIAEQPWCDGQVGTMGLSYSAHTQLAAACLNPPALAAMICDCGGFSNAYQGGIRYGGALEMKQVTWAYRHALRSRAAADNPAIKSALEAADLREWIKRMPWKRGYSPLSPTPDYENFLFEQWEHSKFDDYWKIPALYAKGWYHQMRAVPSVHLSGWYDPYAVSAVENFNGLHEAGHDVSLILGPWTHGNRSSSFAGDVDFGDEATFEAALGMDFVRFRIDLFRHHFKSSASPLASRVNYFVMGGGDGRRNELGRLNHGGRWHFSEHWPPEQSTPVELYLGPKGSLSVEPAAIDSVERYIFDPEDPVPTIGGPITSGAPLMFGGAFDQRGTSDAVGAKAGELPVASRPDVLVFETAPLETAVTLVGNVTVTLFVSSNRPTTDFTAKLVDVYPPNEGHPDGYAMNLTDGILRACYRDGFEEARPMPPGEVVELIIRLYPTANRFETGHRIRLEISSSNFPRFDVNPNFEAGDDLSSIRLRAINAVHSGPQHPSRIETCMLIEE